MIIKELKLPFPFYAERQRQHRFRKNCSGCVLSGLLTPRDSLLPFQIRVEGIPSPLPTVTGWNLYGACDLPVPPELLTDESLVPLTDEYLVALTTESDTLGTVDYDLTTSIGLISVVEHNGGYNIIYNGGLLPASIACGFYEAKITLSNGMTFWSEVFHVLEFPEIGMPYLKMAWSNPTDLSAIVYSTGYENKLFLDSFLSHSDPILTEEVEPDGLGKEIVIFSKATSRFVFSEVVPDYLKNAMAAMPVCRTITVFDPVAGIIMPVTRVRSTSSAEGSGCFSFIEMQLEVDDELYRSACN